MGKSTLNIIFSDMREAKVCLSENSIRQVRINGEDDSEIFSLDLANVKPICAATTAANSNPQPAYSFPVQKASSNVSVRVDPDKAVGQWEEKMRARQEANSFDDKELYKIECKCGTEYYANMSSNSDRARCKECGEKVYADRFVPKKLSSQGKAATLATNRYRVSFVGDSKAGELE